MIKGIEHIAVCAKNSTALTDWYVGMFDWEIVYNNGKGTFFVKAADGSMLEVMPSDGKDFISNPADGGIRPFCTQH